MFSLQINFQNWLYSDLSWKTWVELNKAILDDTQSDNKAPSITPTNSINTNNNVLFRRKYWRELIIT